MLKAILYKGKITWPKENYIQRKIRSIAVIKKYNPGDLESFEAF